MNLDQLMDNVVSLLLAKLSARLNKLSARLKKCPVEEMMERDAAAQKAADARRTYVSRVEFFTKHASDEELADYLQKTLPYESDFNITVNPGFKLAREILLREVKKRTALHGAALGIPQALLVMDGLIYIKETGAFASLDKEALRKNMIDFLNATIIVQEEPGKPIHKKDLLDIWGQGR